MDRQGFRDFQTAWSHFHDGHVPIAHLMRDSGAKHWQRFHSLPESKRYPASKEEMRSVIARATAMAYATLGREDAWLVTTTFEEDEGKIEPAPADIERWLQRQERRRKRRFQRYAVRPAGMAFRGDEDDGSWSIHAALVRWGDRRFLPLLREIALDVDRAGGNWLWMSNRTGAVFAPYDGGADLFLPTPDDVVRARTRWADWLSADPSGL